MFTGIVTDIGTVRSVEDRGDRRVVIACASDMRSVAIGASIACSGVCLTVVETGDDWFAVDVSEESVARTAACRWVKGRRLNLERALRVGDELGGHIVTGHVDAVGEVLAIDPVGGSRRVEIAMPQTLAPFIASKGSITIDGVSLTVNEVCDAARSSFSVNIIPHSWAATTFAGVTVGDEVNLEIDILARYLARMQELN